MPAFPVSMMPRLAGALEALEHWTEAAEALDVTVPTLVVQFREPATPAVEEDLDASPPVLAQPAQPGKVIATLEFELDTATGEYGYRTL